MFVINTGENDEDEEEEEMLLNDIEMLKLWARYYLHPEDPVKVDPAAFGRNYFTRPSAFEDIDDTDINERESILADCAMLKSWADAYLHPEASTKVHPTAVGRNYFNRPSAFVDMEYTDIEDDEEEILLQDIEILKLWARYYLHPEYPVKVDPTAFGRNYFTRPSAIMDMDDTDNEERESILADCAMLKTLATHYYHPEASIKVDPTSLGRNYFTRPSAALDIEICATHISNMDKSHTKESQNNNRQIQSTTKTIAIESAGNTVVRSPSSVMLFGLDGDMEPF